MHTHADGHTHTHFQKRENSVTKHEKNWYHILTHVTNWYQILTHEKNSTKSSQLEL